ncbi:uncharacterized protein METZ01_LOCUS129465 [marine metagenome]|uniref:Uncharacterized protein n=1 Tax=marine metagenome TaxID=408172 RepID=A0A381YJ78_9ZZZZ
MEKGSTSNMSSSSTTKSANLPGSIEPFWDSSNEA